MNSTLVDLGFIEIKWYSFFMFMAMVTASVWVVLESRKKGLDKDTLIDMIFYSLLIGILGARTYYVLFNLSYYMRNPIEII